MSKTKKRYFVRCVESFDFVIPASVLEIRSISDSAHPDACIETPERIVSYVAGTFHELSSARNVKAFCKFHAGKFEAVLSTDSK